MTLDHLSIGQRMTLGFGLLLAFLLGTVGLSMWQQTRLAELTTIQYERPFTVANAVAHAEANIARINRALRDVVLAETPQAVNERAAEMQGLEQKVREDLALARARIPAMQAEVDVLLGKLDTWRPLRDQVVQLKRDGEYQDALAVAQGPSAKVAAEMTTVREALSAHAQAEATHFLEEAHSTQRTSLIWTVGLGLTACLVALGVAWRITRSITHPLREAVDVARAVAGGDLQTRIPPASRSETGQLMQALADMRASLVQVVGQVRDSAQSVALASAEIARGNMDLSQRTEQQAAALQETAASMEQLGSTVHHTADHAREANNMAQGASTVAGQGGTVVARVVDTMQGIHTSSRQIADIITVIDGIAFQTNILALNAAVEAARAGEQGRGFAVVAGEVRTLAQRSAEAAREIKALIGTSVDRVEQGAGLVNEAGRTMQDIVQAIERVSRIVSDISVASSEQSMGVGQASQAISLMDQGTQQNAALVEQSAAAAESLRQQAEQLVAAVAAFRLPHTAR
jgi:methyl-accepting chemotaxis protein